MNPVPNTEEAALKRCVGSAEIIRCREGQAAAEALDQLAIEEPLEIRVGGTPVAVTMRTPGADMELAAGFLLSEGLVRESADIASIVHCHEPGGENVVNVLLEGSTPLDLSRLTRHVFASSSCGVCGKASIEAVHQNFPPIHSSLSVNARLLHALPARMREAQAEFARTGGIHAAAVFDQSGDLKVLREDVGRHNAVDKVLGWGLLHGAKFDQHILLVSGRASFEILQKALASRIPIVCAISAPSSLAVEFARDSGQTLAGFLRNEGMNLYAGAERVRLVGV